MKRTHKEITDSVKLKIESMPIVFPAQYGKIYADASRLRNITLTPEQLLTAELLDEKMVRHIITLSDCAEQAVEAIQTQNLTQLQTILDETKILRDEIKELQKIVYEDTLTKSYNRKWLYDNYLEADQTSVRLNGTIAVVDLDAFKVINDTYGHIIGDKVLIHIAQKLQETGGHVIRYGGDEFLIIFDSDQVRSTIKEKLDTALCYFQKKSFKVEQQNFKVTFSYGIASLSVGADINNVIDKADKAMYTHKTQKQICSFKLSAII